MFLSDTVDKWCTLTSFLAIGMLSACTSSPQTPTADQITPPTFYDYALFSQKNELITLNEFITDNIDADIVLIGEWHRHSGIHRFQSDLLRAMFANNSDVALSMEQFSRNKQAVVNQYLTGEIGEQTLIIEGDAWFNYQSDYRALVEFAKVQGLDVIASNAPKNVVSCIGQEGLQYLDKLDPKERLWVAETISLEDSGYKTRFLASMHHGSEVQNLNHFAAQVTWDETMAESLVHYIDKYPNKKIIHIAGKFHVEGGLGIAASIKARAPNLKVVIISPVAEFEEKESIDDDYQLHVLSPPVQYVNYENMMASYADIALRNHGLVCDK